MAKVFISHAHVDEALASKVMQLLRTALDLNSADFFLSSREGTGVALGMQVRKDVLEKLSVAGALVVLVTPGSAGSPWVWLEAGARLASAEKCNPLFLVPSEAFTNLLKPVGDLRAVCLDKEDQLHSLVETIATSLKQDHHGASKYNSELQEVVKTASRYNLARAKIAASLHANAARLLVAVLLATFAAFGYSFYRSEKIRADAAGDSEDRLNHAIVDTAAQYLVLKGRVISAEGNNIGAATVMASRQDEVHDATACEEPSCTHDGTKTDGSFRLDLTRIQARSGDDIVLSVVKRGFAFDSRQIKVDVRAMHVSDPGNTVTLHKEN